MSTRSKDLLHKLYEARKQENRRVHEQYSGAMEIRNHDSGKDRTIIKTILNDFPEEERGFSHNFD